MVGAKLPSCKHTARSCEYLVILEIGCGLRGRVCAVQIKLQKFWACALQIFCAWLPTSHARNTRHKYTGPACAAHCNCRRLCWRQLPSSSRVSTHTTLASPRHPRLSGCATLSLSPPHPPSPPIHHVCLQKGRGGRHRLQNQRGEWGVVPAPFHLQPPRPVPPSPTTYTQVYRDVAGTAALVFLYFTAIRFLPTVIAGVRGY